MGAHLQDHSVQGRWTIWVHSSDRHLGTYGSKVCLSVLPFIHIITDHRTSVHYINWREGKGKISFPLHRGHEVMELAHSSMYPFISLSRWSSKHHSWWPQQALRTGSAVGPQQVHTQTAVSHLEFSDTRSLCHHHQVETHKLVLVLWVMPPLMIQEPSMCLSCNAINPQKCPEKCQARHSPTHIDCINLSKAPSLLLLSAGHQLTIDPPDFSCRTQVAFFTPTSKLAWDLEGL